MGSGENVYGIPAPLLEQLFQGLLPLESSRFVPEAQLAPNEDLVREDPQEDFSIALAGVRALVPETDGGWESDASCWSD